MNFAVTYYPTTFASHSKPGRLVSLFDLPEILCEFYKTNKTDKAHQPAVWAIATGTRTPVDDFRSGKETRYGDVVLLDFDHISKPTKNVPFLYTGYILDHREDLFSICPYVVAMQESSSGNLHVFCTYKYNSLDEYADAQSVLCAAFSWQLYEYSSHKIDLRIPIEYDQEKRKWRKIIDPHSKSYGQCLKMTEKPLYFNPIYNREEPFSYISFTRNTLSRLKEEYPDIFTVQKTISPDRYDVGSFKLSTDVNKIVEKIKSGDTIGLSYTQRYRLANTMAYFGCAGEDIKSVLTALDDDSDIPRIVNTALRRAENKDKREWFPSSLRLLNNIGFNLNGLRISSPIEEGDYNDIVLPSSEYDETIELSENEYLSDVLTADRLLELSDNHKFIFINADCGVGKTELCFQVLKKRVGDLVVPMTSTLEGKRSPDIHIVEKPHDWSMRISQAEIFDKWVGHNFYKPITLIDELHLTTDQDSFRNVCYKVYQKIIRCSDPFTSIVCFTATPYKEFGWIKDAYRIKVARKSKYTRRLKLVVTDHPARMYRKLIDDALSAGNKVLCPTNKLDQKTRDYFRERSIKFQEYRRDRRETTDVKSINERNAFADGGNLCFCTSYLNVGCEIKGEDKMSTIINLAEDNFTAQQIHQFANRARETNIDITLIVKNTWKILECYSSIIPEPIDTDELIELFNKSDMLRDYSLARFNFLSVDSNYDVIADKDMQSFSDDNAAVLRYYQQLLVILKYFADAGYTFECMIDSGDSVKALKKSDHSVKDEIYNFAGSDPEFFTAVYRRCAEAHNIKFDERIRVSNGVLYTPDSNFTERIYRSITSLNRSLKFSFDDIKKILAGVPYSSLGRAVTIFKAIKSEDSIYKNFTAAILRTESELQNAKTEDPEFKLTEARRERFRKLRDEFVKGVKDQGVRKILHSFFSSIVDSAAALPVLKLYFSDMLLAVQKMVQGDRQRMITVTAEDGTFIRDNIKNAAGKLGFSYTALKKAILRSDTQIFQYKGYVIDRE